MTRKKYLLQFLTLFSFIYLTQSFDFDPIKFRSPKSFSFESPDSGKSFKFKNKIRSEVFDPSYRLPNNLIPSHYNLKIRPILRANGQFDPENYDKEMYTAPGEVKILFRCINATDKIVLHGNFINVTGINYTRVNEYNSIKRTEGPEINILNMTHSKDDRHFYTFYLDQNLREGEEYTIFMKYVAKVNHFRDISGIFLNQYNDTNTGKLKDLCATQLEATSARKLFPHFDEPQMKATFSLAIGRKPSYNSMTNMPIKRSYEDAEGWFWDEYPPTQRMSSYLVAIVVSDFQCVDAEDKELGKPARVCGVPHLIEKGEGEYSAKTSAKLIKYFEDAFKVEYSFPKMDSVALPQFFYGAMENWGLNIYNQKFLLTKKDDPEHYKFTITTLLAHELAHQWFGNHITAKWWSDIFINEGFAEYMAGVATENVVPKFKNKLEARRVLSAQNIMRSDSSNKSRSIIAPWISTPEQIDDMFDGITYGKGSAVVKMMEGFLTRKTLFKGFSDFMNEKAYDSAFIDEFFDTINAAAHNDKILPKDLEITEIMNSWVRQKGFPLIHVHRADKNRIYITQKKFQNKEDGYDFKTTWTVPISLTTQHAPNFKDYSAKLWLKKNKTGDFYPHDTTKWVILNPGSTGYYRVIYDAHMTDLIKLALKRNPTSIDSASRSQLLDDYFQSAYNNYLPLKEALDLSAPIMRSENDLVVWQTFIVNMRKIFVLFRNTNGFKSLKKLHSTYIDNAWVRLEKDTKPDIDGEKLSLKKLLIHYACFLESEKCKSFTINLFKIWRENPEKNPIPADLESTFFCNVVKFGGDNKYNFVLELYREVKNETLKTSLLKGLSCAKNFYSILNLYDFAYGEQGLKKNETGFFLKHLAYNPYAKNVIFKLLRNYFWEIVEYSGFNTVISLFTNFSVYISSKDDLEQLRNLGPLKKMLQNETEFGNYTKIFNSVLFNVEKNVGWMDENYSNLTNWFINNS